MLRVIIRKEILEHIRSFRFAVACVAMLVLFIANGLAWSVRFEQERAMFGEAERAMTDEIRDSAARGLFYVSYGTKVTTPPSPAALCSGGYGHGLPNVASVSAFRLWGIEQKADRNPLLFRTDVDWTFVVGVLGSLMAVLLTFDAIAGEKERGTLRQTLANRIPRDTILIGKYLAALIVISAPGRDTLSLITSLICCTVSICEAVRAW